MNAQEIHPHSSETGSHNTEIPATGEITGIRGLIKKAIQKILAWGRNLKEMIFGQNDDHSHAHTFTKKQVDNANRNDSGKTDGKAASHGTESKNHGQQKVESSPDFNEKMKILQKELGIHPKHILYPCSGPHSIHEAFPESDIIYVDKDDHAIKLHQAAGHKAFKTDVTEFKPDQDPDLTLLINPQIGGEQLAKILQLVKPGKSIAYTIWHGGIQTEMKKHPEFELTGVISESNKLDREHLEDYMTETETHTGSEKEHTPISRVAYKKGKGGELYIFQRKDEAMAQNKTKNSGPTAQSHTV